jgi:deazaflavin-dependent oxidoreductase (nitroreductase family)
MPLPKWLARLNRRVTNRILGAVTPWAPGFGTVIHVGRKSGRTHRTPVNVFRRGTGYVIAVTYGSDSDWVRNVLAAGRCQLDTRSRRVSLESPRLVVDPSRRLVPVGVRPILALLDVNEFLVFETRAPS